MNKPQGYDNYQVGSGRKLPAGGYICKIMNVQETKSKTGKNMIAISLDIAEGEYKCFYAEKYKNNNSTTKKWGCVTYALTEGEFVYTFMGFCKSYELSNGVGINWSNDFGLQFKDKLIGAVFGEEEFEGDKGITTTVKVKTFLPTEKIKNGDYTVPDKLCMQSKPVSNGFIPVGGDVDDDDLPF